MEKCRNRECVCNAYSLCIIDKKEKDCKTYQESLKDRPEQNKVDKSPILDN